MNEVSTNRLAVGLATFAQPTFDVKWADNIRQHSVSLLEQLGVRVVSFPRPLMYEDETREFLSRLQQERVDALFLQCAGFSFGGLPVMLGTELTCPLVIWATPEPEFSGGPIRSNSLCAGIMHNSHLKRAGRRPQFLFGMPGSETAGQLKSMLTALHAAKKLRGAKLGLVGYRAPGFYVSGHDEMKLQADLGVQTVHIDISSVIGRAAKISEDRAEEVIARLGVEISERVTRQREDFLRTVKVFLALQEMARDQNLTVLAVKCWPEFPQEQNINVCFTLSLLNQSGTVTACEADVYGAVTMLIQDLLGEGPEFFNDLIQIDPESNRATYWHCGAAPLALCEDPKKAIVKPHAMRGRCAALNCPLKEGRVTVSRLSEDGDGWKMFSARGEAVQTPMLLEGNSSWVVMDGDVQEMLDLILREGFEHHYSTIYGDITSELEWLCRFLGIRYIQHE